MCLPQVSVRGNKIAVVGGEADERLLHGQQVSQRSNLHSERCEECAQYPIAVGLN